MRDQKPEILMGALFLVFVFLISRHAGIMVSGQKAIAEKAKPVIVIDSGHGGNDPGKVGIDGSLEKDINLQIAQKLRTYLEASDVNVVMTREKDQGLYEESDNHKKMADMKNRCLLIEKSKPELVISIHQNLSLIHI